MPTSGPMLLGAAYIPFTAALSMAFCVDLSFISLFLLCNYFGIKLIFDFIHGGVADYFH